LKEERKGGFEWGESRKNRKWKIKEII
jgi:hypothetical protein